MAKKVLVTTLTHLGGSKFTASGTCDGRAFVANTIVYRNEPIFKVQEADDEGKVSHLRMDSSSFDRGDRIAIARKCKLIRLGELKIDPPSLEELTVKQLRLKAKELDVKGWTGSDIRKADLVRLVKEAQNAPAVAEA
tara:strand:+ start:593 stop:1003 length:411 start_codon:yes stop_codon:yes gene_type:complete